MSLIFEANRRIWQELRLTSPRARKVVLSPTLRRRGSPRPRARRSRGRRQRREPGAALSDASGTWWSASSRVMDAAHLFAGEGIVCSSGYNNNWPAAVVFVQAVAVGCAEETAGAVCGVPRQAGRGERRGLVALFSPGLYTRRPVQQKSALENVVGEEGVLQESHSGVLVFRWGSSDDGGSVWREGIIEMGYFLWGGI